MTHRIGNRGSRTRKVLAKGISARDAVWKAENPGVWGSRRQLHSAGQMPGFAHTANGQEAEIVGAYMALRDSDCETLVT